MKRSKKVIFETEWFNIEIDKTLAGLLNYCRDYYKKI